MPLKQLVSIEEAKELLQKKEVVAIPTETVYGLAGDATSDVAIAKIFAAKGRPSDNPLIVHIGELKQLNDVAAAVPDVAKKLMSAFWPGPLTVILPKQRGLSEQVTAGLQTVGVRMPSHPIALELLKAVKLPLAAPSANLSGRPSPTTALHVAHDLNGKIAGIVDGGKAGIGIESTVIDCTLAVPLILRPGGVTKKAIEAVIGQVGIDSSLKNHKMAPKSPGMKYTHYAPQAPMALIKGSPSFFREVIRQAQRSGKKIGVLTVAENKVKYDADVVLTCGTFADHSLVAKELYEILREFDRFELDVIYSESFSEEGLGEAIMNRLLKASGYSVIEEEGLTDEVEH